MLLVIDIGNTEIVLGLFVNEALRSHWRLSSTINRTSDEYWILFTTWCRQMRIDVKDIKGTVICSVVPSLSSAIAEFSTRYLNLDPLFITSETNTGLNILYDTPRTVGADRICNAVAGFDAYGGPLIVVDFGTATTFDVVSEKGEYVGGIIALGVMGSSHELHRIAAKLPRVNLEFPSKVVGNTTESSMQSGIMWGTVALIEGLIDRISNEMNWKTKHVIATGGISEIFSKKCRKIDASLPFLTLNGMRLIYNRNQ